MKHKKIYLILGIFIIAGFFWNSCWKVESMRFPNNKKIEIKKNRITKNLDSKNDEIREYVERGNVNIQFYGKVVDENGKGLEGVSISYLIQGAEAISGVVKGQSDRGTVISSKDGNFEISKGRGSSLSIGPLVKRDYRDTQKDVRSFGFMGNPDPHKPDPQNSIQFVMVKDVIPKTKEIYQKRLRFAWNQGEVRIPLGNKLGDIIIVPSRMKKSEELRDFDWNVKVNMEQAELISLGEYYAPIAPDAGYQSSFEYGTSKGDDKIPGGASKTLAFKTTDGFYGIVRLSVYPDREDFGVNGSLNVRINPSGARNLD